MKHKHHGGAEKNEKRAEKTVARKRGPGAKKGGGTCRKSLWHNRKKKK
jgi:hypothetical protein